MSLADYFTLSYTLHLIGLILILQTGKSNNTYIFDNMPIVILFSKRKFKKDGINSKPLREETKGKQRTANILIKYITHMRIKLVLYKLVFFYARKIWQRW